MLFLLSSMMSILILYRINSLKEPTNETIAFLRKGRRLTQMCVMDVK